MAGEVICQRVATPLRALRSTVVVSGVSVLRARGLFERYQAHLGEEARTAILGALAGTWLPVGIGLEHFAAADSLGLSDQEAFDVGATSGRRFGATLWGTLVRLAKAAGADPWIPLRSYDRIFGRTIDGGGFIVRQVGPKEAIIEIQSLPFARYAYFRNASRGAHATMFDFFASRVFVREVPRSVSTSGYQMNVAWV